MASSDAIKVGDLRTAVAAQVASTSLREVARQVGLSPTGLQNFLDGNRSYVPTRRKLERWYVLRHQADADDLTGDVALQVLGLVVQDLTPARHGPALESLLSTLERTYAAAGVDAPPWLDQLRALVRRDPPAPEPAEG